MSPKVSEHASDIGAWRICRLAPSPALAPFLGWVAAYEDRATEFRRRRELPDGRATLLFNLGDDLAVELRPGERSAWRAGQSFFSGASEHFVVTQTNGAQAGAQAMLTLLGARRLAGAPLAEFGDTLVDPRDALGLSACELSERLAQANSQEARLAALASVIEARLARSTPLPGFLEYAFARLERGRIAVGQLAREIGCSRKHLTTCFSREFGIAPKMFARLRRFDRARGFSERKAALGDAEIAIHCGYADQAHMIREFREFAGLPPAALRRRELPDGGGFLA